MLSIQIENLSKSFGDKKVLEKVSLDLEAGSFTSVVGPSGCGKSTLLKILAHLEKATSGTVRYSEAAPPVGFVFQEPRLLRWLNLVENIKLPLRLTGAKDSTAALEVLQKVGLQGAEDLFPHQLSGGMKMRASLARALIVKPKLLLLDEAFAALDEKIRYELQEDLYQLWLKEKMTVLFVTHSLSEALYLSERIVLLKSGLPGFQQDINLKEKLSGKREKELRTSPELNKILRELSEAF